MSEIKITKERLQELQDELATRTGETRAKIGDEVLQAKRQGDLKENAEYHIARAEQSKNEERIAEIENILKIAVILDGHAVDEIGVGSCCTVIDDTGAEHKWQIVDEAEADIARGKMSQSSPIGSALFGKKTGDTAQVKLPKGIKKYKIKSIE